MNSCGSSSSNGVSLSDDLLTEILTRLPLKSLFRFNCVSKAWYGLISDHHLRSKLPLITSGVYYCSNSNLISREPRYAHTSGNGLQDCNLDFFPFHNKSSIIDSCNGLLLCYSCLDSTFYVVSPTTKRWMALPEPMKRSQLSILTFDPCHSPNYKVICFTSWLEEGSEIEVFSSETGRWVEHELHWGLNTDTVSATMQYFDGVLYILAYPKHIVAIGLAEMDCHLIELPEPMKREASVGKSRGCLHYTHNDGEQLRIWKLKDSINVRKWVLKHRIDVRAIVEQNYKRVHSSAALSGRFNFLAFHPQKEVVYLSVPGKLVSYDLSKKRIQEICEFGKGKEKERAQLIQIWLFPFSRYISDCLANV